MNKILCAFLIFYATLTIVTCELECYECTGCEDTDKDTTKTKCADDLKVCVTEGTGKSTNRKCAAKDYCLKKENCDECDESLCNNSSGSVYPQIALVCSLVAFISMYRQ